LSTGDEADDEDEDELGLGEVEVDDETIELCRLIGMEDLGSFGLD
jgi:hypothetical protein